MRETDPEEMSRMFDPDELRRLEGEYNNALEKLKKCVPGKPGFSAESKYGETYQQLVLAGAKPQLKLKYRGK